MEYRELATLSEYDFWDIIQYWNDGASVEEIRRRKRIPIPEVTKILNYHALYPLRDFKTLHSDFLKSEKFIKIVFTPNFNYLRDIQLRPILIEGLPGYGKSELLKWLYRTMYLYYIKQYIPRFEERSKGLLTITTLVSNNFNYIYDNFPQADIAMTGVEDADREHTSYRTLSPENVEAIQKLWDIRHVQEDLYEQRIGLVANAFITHLHVTILKSIRNSAKYVFYKNIFTDVDENKDLEKNIGKLAFNFLKTAYHWKDISPIFAKFFVLKVGGEAFLGKFPLVKMNLKKVFMRATPKKNESDSEPLQEILAIRLLGMNGARNKYSYSQIRELLDLDLDEKRIADMVRFYLRDIKEKYQLKKINES